MGAVEQRPITQMRMFGAVTLVGVTSSIDRADGMASELVAVGMRPVMLPCTTARVGSADHIARIRAACDEVDLIVLDSVRPIDILWSATAVPAAPFAVSNRAVAAAVEAKGGTVEMVGDGRCAEFATSLVPAIEARSVAFPHASDTDPRAIVALADSARMIVAAPVYTTYPCSPALDAVDAAVFVSPLAVHGWASARSFTGLTVATLGRSTRLALSGYDRDPDVETSAPEYSALSSALARFLS